MAVRHRWAVFFLHSSITRFTAALICFSMVSACSSSNKTPEDPASTEEKTAPKSDEKSEAKPKVKRKRSDDYPGLW